MAKGTEQEYEETRDARLLAAVRGITAGQKESRAAIEMRMQQNSDAIERLVHAVETRPEPAGDDNKDLADIKSLLDPITAGMQEISELLRARPTRYRVQRDALGFIQEVIAE